MVSDGVSRLADGSSLAGSTITVADAVARFVDGRPDRLPPAVRASSARAASVLGLRPPLSVGAAADLVVRVQGGRVEPLRLGPTD